MDAIEFGKLLAKNKDLVGELAAEFTKLGAYCDRIEQVRVIELKLQVLGYLFKSLKRAACDIREAETAAIPPSLYEQIEKAPLAELCDTAQRLMKLKIQQDHFQKCIEIECSDYLGGNDASDTEA